MSDNTPHPNWQDLVLASDPNLFIGWRGSDKLLEARRIPLHRSTHSTLRGICQNTLESLSHMEIVCYGPYAEVERGEEFLSLILEEDREAARETDLPSIADASLVQIALNFAGIEVVGDRPILDEKNFQFYGIAFETQMGNLCFIRKSSPRRSLERGATFFQFGQQLKKIDQPDLVLDDTIDIVVTSGHVAILNPVAFNVLAGDIGFTSRYSQQYVNDLVSHLHEKIPFAASSIDSLNAIASRKISVAKRLAHIARDVRRKNIDTKSIRKALKSNGEPASVLFDENGELSFDESGAELFIDLIEGRLFTQDFTASRARADRYRIREPRS